MNLHNIPKEITLRPYYDLFFVNREMACPKCGIYPPYQGDHHACAGNNIPYNGKNVWFCECNICDGPIEHYYRGNEGYDGYFCSYCKNDDHPSP